MVMLLKKHIVLLVVFLMSAVTGCCSENDYVRISFPCGTGSLEFVEHVTKTFETTYSNYNLYLFEGKKKRKICSLPTLPLYTAPSIDERFYRLNQVDPDYAFTVFVNPKEFTVDEYEQIAKSLKEGLKTATKDVPEIFKSISSIRYIDESKLTRTYKTKIKNLTLEISSDGSVTLVNNRSDFWGKNNEYDSIGQLVDNGKILLLNTNQLSTCKENNVEILTLVKGAVAANGKTLIDEFKVESHPDEEYCLRLSEWKQKEKLK